MKKFLVLLLIGSSGYSHSQWTNGDTITDFTLDDLYGNEHNLYTQLDNGKVVVLDFFFPACAPCWSGTMFHTLKDFTAAYDAQGSNQVRTFGLNVWGTGEGTWTGDLAIDNIHGVDVSNQNFTRGDFDYFTNFPILPQGSDFGDTAQIVGAPTYMIVCPNRRAYTTGTWNLASNISTYCGVSLQKPLNNVWIYVPELSTCQGLDRVNIYGYLRNAGSNNVTSARVKLMVNNTVIAIQDMTFSGTNNTSSTASLTEFKFENVLMDQPLGDYSKGPYKIVVDMINGVALTTPEEKIIKINVTTQNSNATNFDLELKTDGYASETSWLIYNQLGEIVAQNPTLTNNVTTNTPVTLTNNNCYTVRLRDTYGDGISDGYLKITDPSSAVMADLRKTTYNYEDWGYDLFHSFRVGSFSNLSFNELVETDQFGIYPNPTTDKLFVQTTEKVTVNIIDLNGRIIRSMENVDHTTPIAVSELSSGVYLAKIQSENAVQLIHFTKN